MSTEDKTPENKPEEQKPEEQKKPDANIDVKIPDSYWETYFKNMNNDYLQEVIATAREDKYMFEVLDDDGNVVDKIDAKRKKLPTKKYRELEHHRAKFNKETDREKAQTILAELYEKLAWLCFGIPKEKFEMTDWEQSKRLCDAAEFIALYGRPK